MRLLPAQTRRGSLRGDAFLQSAFSNFPRPRRAPGPRSATWGAREAVPKEGQSLRTHDGEQHVVQQQREEHDEQD